MKHLKTLYVGIDISLKNFNTDYIDIESNSYLSKKNKIFINNPSGLDSFMDAIVSICVKHDFRKIKIGYEATNNYGFHIPFYLTESPKLKNFEIEIFQINPKIIKNARKSFSELPKDDFNDAYVISERLKIGKLPPYNRFNPHYLSLRFLTRARFVIVKKITSLKARFLSILFIKASGFIQNKVFSKTLNITSLNLLTFFNSVEEIANMQLYEIANFILKHSKNKFAKPEDVAKKIKYIAKESYRINRVMHDSITYSLLTLFNQIKFLSNELKQTDKQIEKTIMIFENQYNILKSIRGIGPVFAAGIIAELGDLSDFDSQKAIAKFSGLIWRIRQSGKYKSEETELTKSGNKYLRYYLVEAAQSLVMHNIDFLPYYHKKYNEATKHKHKRAILFIARKLIRIIYSLLKNNKLYQTPKYIFENNLVNSH